MPTKTAQNIGNNVKYYRKVRNLSTQAAASACGIRPNTWNNIERALVDPKVSTLEAMAFTLEIPVSALFTKLWPNLQPPKTKSHE